MTTRRTFLSSAAAFGTLAAAAPAAAGTHGPDGPRPPHHAETPHAIDGFPLEIPSGSWNAGHIQGIAIDERKGFVYHSFTQMLIKTDLEGTVVGSVVGLTGHLGDLDFNTQDGRVYGSLEYKAEEAFYIAIFEVDRITEIGMPAEGSDLMTTVHLEEVVADFTADMDGDGVFDGDVGDTPDHRYGCSGIDGVSFGPAFGSRHGKRQLMVAYGIYGNVDRQDHAHQVILQYDITKWSDYEQPLTQTDPHRSGPAAVEAKYFVRTGNTRYGVQNLSYDAHSGYWYLGVYRGAKPEFPNGLLYVIDGSVPPQEQDLLGQPEPARGLVVPLLEEGIPHPDTGIFSWEIKTDVGMEPIGHGYFYLARDFDDHSSGEKQESATLELHRWTGEAPAGFERVIR